MYNSPLVITIFRRPDTTLKVFKAINNYRFPKIYIIADGPRDGYTEENTNCSKTRIIADNFPFISPVEKIYRESNLGIKDNLLSALNYIFQNEKRIYFLEDDHIPSSSFFDFIDSIWEQYPEKKLYHINGTNLNSEKKGFAYLSKLSSFWGCSISRDAWQNFDYELIKRITEDEVNFIIENTFRKKLHVDYFKNLYKYHRNNEAEDVFDQRWLFYIWHENAYAITPHKNLVQNIGIHHENAYSQRKDKKSCILIARTKIANQIDITKQNKLTKYNYKFDEQILNEIFSSKTNIITRIRNKIKITLKKS